MTAKQSHLPGLELPAQPDIEEATRDLREAKEAARRASEVAKQAEAVLIMRMMTAKVAKHRYHDSGRYVDIEITLPQPSVRVRVMGGDSDES
jgi:hypothetical protein